MAFKPTTNLLVRDYKPGVVNLVQFPRTHVIVSPSPFALKLETWLRVNKIPYHNVSNEFAKGSAKGQVPFIELDGQQFSDSNFIIEHLATAMNVGIDNKLTTRQRAEARAISVLIEESLFRCLAYERSLDFNWIATDKGFLPHFSGLKKILFQKIGPKQAMRGIKRNLVAQGYGRHSHLEIEKIAKKDLMALSEFVGDRKFIFGEAPSTVDITLFGTVVQFLDTPLKSEEIKPFIEQSCSNLVEFCNRIKAEFWPDWNEIIENLTLNKEEPKPAEQQQSAPAEPQK